MRARVTLSRLIAVIFSGLAAAVWVHDPKCFLLRLEGFAEQAALLCIWVMSPTVMSPTYSSQDRRLRAIHILSVFFAGLEAGFTPSSFLACWTAFQAIVWSFFASAWGTDNADFFLPDPDRTTLAGRPTADLL